MAAATGKEDSSSYKITKPGYHQEILDELPKDLKLICADGFVEVHRFILMGVSSFLRTLLSDKETDGVSSLTMDDVSVLHLRKVLKLFYHGQVVVDEAEVEAICQILEMFQFPFEQIFYRKATKRDISRDKVAKKRPFEEVSVCVEASTISNKDTLTIQGRDSSSSMDIDDLLHYAVEASASQTDSSSTQSTFRNEPDEMIEVVDLTTSPCPSDPEDDYDKDDESNGKEDETNLIYVHKIKDVTFIMEMLKNPGFQLVRTANGKCAIHFAVESNDAERVKCLLDNDICNLNETDRDGNTPLHLAIKQKLDSMIELLIERGAPLEAVNREGMTPMFQAVNQVDGGTQKILSQMDRKGLRMEDHARDALIFLLKKFFGGPSTNLMNVSAIIKVFQYFIEKGGVLQFNHHWKNPTSLRLLGSIDFNKRFLQRVKMTLKITHISTPQNFIDQLRLNSVTLDKLLLCLLESKQVEIVKSFVNQLILKKFTKYSKCHPHVREALDSDEKIIVIKALNKNICLSRINDTIVNVEWFHQVPESETKGDGLYALSVGEFTSDVRDCLNRKPGTFIVVTKSVSAEVVDDTIEWDDLSREARWELGTPGDYSGFRFSQESESLFFDCLRDLSPRNLGGQNCYTFFQFMNGAPLINLMKRKITLSEIMGEMFDECVKGLSRAETYILEEIAMKGTFRLKRVAGPAILKLDLMENLVVKSWLKKENNEFMFENKFASSYFLAQRLFRKGLSLRKIKFLFRCEKKSHVKVSRWQTKWNAVGFKDESFIFFFDRLLGKEGQSKFRLNSEEDFMIDQFVEACATSNAHNLIEMLSRKTQVKCLSDCVIPILVSGTVHLSDKRIQERKQLIQNLVSNGNESHMKELCLNNWRDSGIGSHLFPVEMPLVHVDLLKLLLELDCRTKGYSTFPTWAHLAPFYMPLEQFQLLVDYLLEKGLARQLFSVGKDKDWSPLLLIEKFFKRRWSVQRELAGAGIKDNPGVERCIGEYYKMFKSMSLYSPMDYFKVVDIGAE